MLVELQSFCRGVAFSFRSSNRCDFVMLRRFATIKTLVHLFLYFGSPLIHCHLILLNSPLTFHIECMSGKTSNQDTPRKFLRYARRHLFPLILLLNNSTTRCKCLFNPKAERLGETLRFMPHYSSIQEGKLN